MTQKSFYAVVGPEGSGKTKLCEGLRLIADPNFVDFLCDSSAQCNAPHVRFTERVTQISRDERLHLHTTPRSQILFFWARLTAIIEQSVRPSLAQSKTVVINGFGGTILANALLHASSEAEREDLLGLHKDCIKHCVVGNGVPPPIYLWLKPSPEVARRRLLQAGRCASDVTLEKIEKLNREFKLYGEIPGQYVIPVDADQEPEVVLCDVLKHMNMPLREASLVF